ncbi:MAG: pyridoxamine 5'-phosphate oxidase family protein [Bacteroidales bacterium]|nr:pyridoxamine 5'-phosphate oxidase family protein [Bacteroidales bacterium]
MRRNDREITNQTEIETIIQKADVCRIALIDDGLPYIVALNFGYKAGNPAVLYFHCANEGRKLNIIEKNNSVCFQMDVDHELVSAKKACGYTMKFKSIVGYGKIHKVVSKEEKIEGLNYIMKQYSENDNFDYADKMLDITTILKLKIEKLTGKKKE